ncbi:MAG: transcriptional repressor LexA [Gammaproteobacteria bacterium]|jgi:repressor LexA|nr:transcriptional repressor LexA [Gammaproteobacteria bacterium]
MSAQLTARQRQILELIRRHVRETGYPPTRAEIAQAFGFRSVTAAVDHLKALARHGVIEMQQGASRGIRLLVPAEDELQLPVVGRVAAGSPILAAEHIEEHHHLDPALFHPRADYLLRVRGVSMRDAGILDGDLLAVHRTPAAENGQIVVARLDDEVTVKRFRQQANWRHRVQLLPENPDFAAINVDLREQTLVIEGLGVGVLRRGLMAGGGARRL